MSYVNNSIEMLSSDKISRGRNGLSSAALRLGAEKESGTADALLGSQKLQTLTDKNKEFKEAKKFLKNLKN